MSSTFANNLELEKYYANVDYEQLPPIYAGKQVFFSFSRLFSFLSNHFIPLSLLLLSQNSSLNSSCLIASLQTAVSDMLGTKNQNGTKNKLFGQLIGSFALNKYDCNLKALV